jgi:hypothetical protein
MSWMRKGPKASLYRPTRHCSIRANQTVEKGPSALSQLEVWSFEIRVKRDIETRNWKPSFPTPKPLILSPLCQQ